MASLGLLSATVAVRAAKLCFYEMGNSRGERRIRDTSDKVAHKGVSQCARSDKDDCGVDDRLARQRWISARTTNVMIHVCCRLAKRLVGRARSSLPRQSTRPLCSATFSTCSTFRLQSNVMIPWAGTNDDSAPESRVALLSLFAAFLLEIGDGKSKRAVACSVSGKPCSACACPRALPWVGLALLFFSCSPPFFRF